MPKMKTNRGALKRFPKATASGKRVRNQSHRRHLAESKSSKRKRQLRSTTLVNKADETLIFRMLPNHRAKKRPVRTAPVRTAPVETA